MNILKRWGLIVYDIPYPHIDEQDLKLALGPVRFEELERYHGQHKLPYGYPPEVVEEYLEGERYH